MSLDGDLIARHLTIQTGLKFTQNQPKATMSQVLPTKRSVDVVPSGYPPSHSFSLRGSVGWRDVEIAFIPGAFAGSLVREMGRANAVHRRAFVAVCQQALELGASVKLEVNGLSCSFDDYSIWEVEWALVEVVIRKGNLGPEEIGSIDAERTLIFWMAQMMTGILALLSVEDMGGINEACCFEGFPEGALSQIRVNRYERDPKNRAAALAFHGAVCLVCRQDLSELYGEIGAGAVEVHHIIPVSELGEGYHLDPSRDLAPLCPNCHAIAHRRNPPFSIQELKDLRSKTREAAYLRNSS